jgi:DNA-binding GntR family transcriptional regulator
MEDEGAPAGVPGNKPVMVDALANVLNRASPEPLYLQIKNWMMREIDAGRWPVHYKLPAEEDLARTLQVNRGTLRQAIRELIQAGRLTQIHGKGTFVESPQIEQPLAERLVTFSEELLSRSIAFTTSVIEQSVIRPSQRVASLLALPPNAEVLYLKRVRAVDGVPLILLVNYVVLQRCPRIVEIDFTQQRLFEVLEERFGLRLDWGRRTFAARRADAETAAMLGVAVGDAAMYIEQVTYLDDGAPIEFSDIWCHGDRFHLSATVKRGSATRNAVPGDNGTPQISFELAPGVRTQR